jgi:tetratricopeptide (TPR) repeat protein
MKILECPESDQYVYRAINMSYQKCSSEEKVTLFRLAVFEGNFSEDAARVVIEKENLDTKRVLKKLVRRSLIKQPTKHRYSIHLLIKHFLKYQQESENETAERESAQVLMVKYYLELGHQLTMKSYSKDGYKVNREALKQEADNIQNVLKICCQQKGPKNPDISDRLAHSKVYTTSAKFFSLFVRTIIPGSIVDEFLQRCANLAEEKKQHPTKINFDCLVADQERGKSIGKSDECFNSKMEEIKKEFDTHYEDLKEDKSLCAHYYYQYGRYLSRKSEGEEDKKRLDLLVQARDEEKKSFELRMSLTDTSVQKADTMFSLLHLGNICKIISVAEYLLKEKYDSENSLRHAQQYYEEAIQLSKEHLGKHELTAACYKSLGDLFLRSNPKSAEKSYTIATEMRENLGLDASERHVRLLNNLGKSLMMINRANQAIEVLQNARDMAEKLADSDDPNETKAKVYTSLVFAHEKERNYSDASTYARKALEFSQIEKCIKKYEYKKLQEMSLMNKPDERTDREMNFLKRF